MMLNSGDGSGDDKIPESVQEPILDVVISFQESEKEVAGACVGALKNNGYTCECRALLSGDPVSCKINLVIAHGDFSNQSPGISHVIIDEAATEPTERVVNTFAALAGDLFLQDAGCILAICYSDGEDIVDFFWREDCPSWIVGHNTISLKNLLPKDIVVLVTKLCPNGRLLKDEEAHQAFEAITKKPDNLNLDWVWLE